MHRRSFLHGGLAALCTAALPTSVLAALRLGAPAPFDFAALKGRARALAAQPHAPRPATPPDAVAALDWDAYQALRFRQDHALWHEDDTRHLAQFFHLGLFFKRPVRMHALADGQAREIAYDPAMFDYGASGLDGAALPADLGFAGFRLNRRSDPKRDFAAFLGASYFRAVGASGQYGLSARGLAVDTGLPRPEEFPDFTDFWLERPAPDSDTVVVYALLDSPSVAGAYRFAITPGEPLVMDVDCALYPRTAIERLGIAPATSMYQTGENDRRMAWDWRPEIHDSDGLALHTGGGEWLWRPLENPRALRFNAFADDNPRGFGLLQRDRDFDHYQDDGVFYERRPSLWVEPRDGWGRGEVQLVEIPTVDETFDNVVAFWHPAQPVEPGRELLFGYRLFWGEAMPARPPLATCVATRTGLGGRIGFAREQWSQRFAVDFAGGVLAALAARNATVEPVLQATAGRLETVSARPLHAVEGYRVMFDVVPPGPGTGQLDIRLFLRDPATGDALSETWLYQWNPPPPEARQVY
ncbi:glucan biosynthesis protein D [Luteimonas sp. FCS-9]|uniref:glucan biosynthesis protein n=1 Tax=Luteimonas sp. FCS-9 TaxID=1547516 RepID=UPI00063E8B6F|nr:glucan biosynthesis protein D [Luteimonas sp. FCS-9]KLI98753.1 glucan biosynthesis protein D [Luteimonas sp. FCS-9]